MYRYDEFDHQFVRERVEQFRGQVSRRLSGDLNEDEFKPLRLLNGLYLQLHAYMLRVAVPYGVLSSRQLRMLAHIARTYDRGYGHITTRQNIQFNWPELSDVPDILADLGTVEMHAIQTSGNCIRNVTADQFAGVVADEIEDPRVYCEIIRQWSTHHPEFTFLPRKFKIAVTGSPVDRAATAVHDIGLRLIRNDAGAVGFEVLLGGGQGRTPMLAHRIREFLPKADLLSYLEAILRVYNQLGRRDNLYKARLKILVRETGAARFAELVEAEWVQIRDGALALPLAEIDRINAYFAPPSYRDLGDEPGDFAARRAANSAFAQWVETNVHAHKVPGYAIVTVSLKPHGAAPGDISDGQMDALADIAERFSFAELRATHEQNIVLADVERSALYDLWLALADDGLATPNAGLLTDIICCPGLDFCNLANARSIPISQRISRRFDDLARLHDIGPLKIKISGCINACGHHHVGHIGILGVEKKGTELHQVSLGGSAEADATLGDIIGPAFTDSEVVDAVETIVTIYLDQREDGEAFLDTYRRVGLAPFRGALYATH